MRKSLSTRPTLAALASLATGARWHLVPLGIALSTASGCAFTIDDNPSPLPLVGAPPPLGTPFNKAPVKSSYVVAGRDHAYWLAVQEVPNTLRLVRLSPPATEEVTYLAGASRLLSTWRAFYFLDEDPSDKHPTQQTHLTIRSAGQTTPPDQLLLPPGPTQLISGGNDDIFAHWSENPDKTVEETTLFISRRDGSFSRQLPLPTDPKDAGVTSSLRSQMGFSGDAKLFYTHEANHHLVAHSTIAEIDTDLGVIQDSYVSDESRRNFLDWGPKGLRQVSSTNTGIHVLDPTPGQVVGYKGASVLYAVGSQLLAVPLDPGGDISVVFDGPIGQLYGFAPDGTIVFSHDPPDRYVQASGDGWLGTQKFMERGGDPTFSADGKRLRWLDHTALPSGVGDLLSAPLTALGAPLLLARNVRQYNDLGDGRVLVADNQPFVGVQNRVIIVDEITRQASWVAAGGRRYRGIPGSTDLLVDVVTGVVGYDIIRVPLPPDPHPPSK